MWPIGVPAREAEYTTYDDNYVSSEIAYEKLTICRREIRKITAVVEIEMQSQPRPYTKVCQFV